MKFRQRRYAAEYMLDADRGAAAIRAGYSRSGATNRACLLMRDAEVAAMIAREQRARERRTGVTRERVLMELARIAFADLARFAAWDAGDLRVKLDQLRDDDAAAIAELRLDPKGQRPAVQFFDKGEALELLARHCGLYDDPANEPHASGRERLMARLRPYLEAAVREGE